NSEGQNLRYAYYSNGYLMAVADQNESSRSLTEYAYDRDGNRTQEWISSRVGLYGAQRDLKRVTETHYDSQNRMQNVTVSDWQWNAQAQRQASGNKLEVSYVYDANGNVRTTTTRKDNR
ncbi:hypothetical protein, partial [Parachitinimonas caeni]